MYRYLPLATVVGISLHTGWTTVLAVCLGRRLAVLYRDYLAYRTHSDSPEGNEGHPILLSLFPPEIPLAPHGLYVLAFLAIFQISETVPSIVDIVMIFFFYSTEFVISLSNFERFEY